MPNLGDKLSIRCSDHITRTGTVVYIHPDHIFAVLQFDFWREAFFLRRPGRECRASSNHPEAHGQTYTPAEDAEILASNDLADTARKLGRTECAVEARQAVLHTEKSTLRTTEAGYRKFTRSEDAVILKSHNLTETARKLDRKPGSVWARQKTLRRRKACITRST